MIMARDLSDFTGKQVARNHFFFFFRLHRKLVRGFFSNASHMLTENGEVHITHKTTWPFSKWEIVELAEEIGLCLVEKVTFERGHYPGYMNKRGSGPKTNRTFRVGECSTFKFSHI
jgi:25S rRNA (uracil2634-N3)-methyltransferase